MHRFIKVQTVNDQDYLMATRKTFGTIYINFFSKRFKLLFGLRAINLLSLLLLLISFQPSYAQITGLTVEKISPEGVVVNLDNFDDYVIFKDKLFFFGRMADSGRWELWVSDGTEAGTQNTNTVKSFKYSATNSPLHSMIATNDFFLFREDKDTFWVENGSVKSGVREKLWVSDGTTTGTKLITKFDTIFPQNLAFDRMATINNKVLIKACPGNNNIDECQLWITDGTDEGTEKIKDSIIVQFDSKNYKYKDKLYFFGINSKYGEELWVTDGTSIGTHIVKDINPGIAGCNCTTGSYSFFTYKDELYFMGDDGSGFYFWHTDGTEEGTRKISKDYNYSLGFLASSKSYIFNNKIFFVGNNGSYGNELWISDGTVVGTKMFKDINLGANSAFSTISEFQEFNGKLYFGADDGIHGNELWVSDGTAQGTHIVTDLVEGANSLAPSEYFVLNNNLYCLVGANNMYGRVIKTDGSAGGTMFVPGIDIGNAVNIRNSFVYNGRLFIKANINGSGGNILYALNDARTKFEVAYENTQYYKWISDNTQIIPHDGSLFFVTGLSELMKLSFSPLANILINQKTESGINCFPNPADDYLIIECSDNNTTFTINNILGQKIKEFTLSKGQNTIDISDLESGLYIILDNTHSTSQKLIKK
ncbi:MAG: T9SS type A sorting domain-containing protein [Bacteroidetes bacterium]|nr:T9SS type A sorting domain-containing protein [Bacteroidota bacterium]